MKRALITGITGQDGAYLARFLLEKGYKVYGVARSSSHIAAGRHRLHWLGIDDDVEIIYADILDLSSVIRVLDAARPDEIYNLAAQSFVGVSWDQPILTSQITGIGVLNILEGVRIAAPKSRFYQASSSEMFGEAQAISHNEQSPFHPRSPYATAKLLGHWTTVNYRDSFNLYTCSGILFNHESPIRGLEFVSRKITDAAARVKLGLSDRLFLGNLEASRDWGHARDYVRAMWLMLQQDEPTDFVVATGRVASVRELCDMAFGFLGLRAADYIRNDPKLIRPSDVQNMCGDATRISNCLGWKPLTSLEDMIQEMVEEDLRRLR